MDSRAIRRCQYYNIIIQSNVHVHVYAKHSYTYIHDNPAARGRRTAGLSNRFCPSVSQSVSQSVALNIFGMAPKCSLYGICTALIGYKSYLRCRVCSILSK